MWWCACDKTQHGGSKHFISTVVVTLVCQYFITKSKNIKKKNSQKSWSHKGETMETWTFDIKGNSRNAMSYHVVSVS